MRHAYDTFLLSAVSADGAARSEDYEQRYRYKCACCGEEVYLAAPYSVQKATHFRHRSGNNDIECENYLRQYRVADSDLQLRKGNRERVEFYFDSNNKVFTVAICFSAAEIQEYEQQGACLELRARPLEKPFFSLKISSQNFTPEIATSIKLTCFSNYYYLSNTHDGIKREYTLLNESPTFFKIQGNDKEHFRARLVRGKVLYTKMPYIVIFQNNQWVPFVGFSSSDVSVLYQFKFSTMGDRVQMHGFVNREQEQKNRGLS